jgi:hypothetical protein
MASGYAQGGGGGQVGKQAILRAKKQQQTGGGSDMDIDARFKADIAKLNIPQPQLRLGFEDVKYLPELKATIHFTPIKNPVTGIPNYSEDDPVLPLFSYSRNRMNYICFLDGNVFDMQGNLIGNLNWQALM